MPNVEVKMQFWIRFKWPANLRETASCQSPHKSIYVFFCSLAMF